MKKSNNNLYGKRANRAIKLLLSILVINILLNTPALCQTWEQLTPHPAPPVIPTMAAANGKIYVLSGTIGESFPAYEYDPETNAWTQKSALPEGCYYATAATVDNKIYVMGGGQPTSPTKYNYIFDPISNTWTRGADLLTPRMYHNAVVAYGKIYLIGGQNGDGTTEWYFEVYDPATDSWATKAPLINNGAWYCGAASLDSKIYRIAGGGYSASLIRDHFDVYDINTNTWTEKTKFHRGLHASFAVAATNKIWVLGGQSDYSYMDSIWIYDAFSDEWSVPGFTLPEPRSYHRAAVLDSCIYVFGGQNSLGELKNSLIRYCSSVITGNNTKTTVADNIIIYPNPGNGKFIVKSESKISGPVNIEVWNSLGQLEYAINKDLFESKTEFEIEMNKKSIEGLYILKINTKYNSYTKKILINH